MNCHETQAVIDGYVDRELDLVTSLELEHHLETCDACSQMYANRQALQAAIRAGSLYHHAPGHLQNRVLAAIQQADKAEADQAVTTPVTSFQTKPAKTLRWKEFAAAASVLVAGLFGWSLGHISSVQPATDTLAHEVFADDMRSLMTANKGIDVLSSNKHTVKPWFAGKLDFSPPVEDFAPKGYPLIGGRRDYINGRTVAVLVYKRHAHWINLYLWPSTNANSEMKVESSQGYHLLHWDKDGITYWAVSDVNTQELEDFARLIQSEA